MRPPPFEYVEPETVEEACAVLDRHAGAAVVLAGGQSLVPQLNAREIRPEVVVGIRRLTELQAVTRDGDVLRIGACVTQRAFQRHPLAGAAPLLCEALEHVGHVPTRNRGTLGGSIAFADPTAELPTALLALGGAARLRSSAGERVVPAAELYAGPFRTALQPGELLTAVEVPVVPGWRWAFEQRHYRRHAKVSVAAGASADGGTVAVALGGVGDTPVVLPVRPGDAEAAVAAAQDLVTPVADHLASVGYRRTLLGVALPAALRRVLDPARTTEAA